MRLSMSDEFPGAGSYRDRHGKRRWRFRHGKRLVQLPGDPAESDANRAAYLAAVEGRASPKPAPVVQLPTASAPRSFKAAWRLLRTEDPDWKALANESREAQTRVAERFLMMEIVEGEKLTFGDVDVGFLKRKHIKALLARKSDTPHAGTHLLRIIRKLVLVALDQEWIENDPAYRLKYRPGYGGWKAWPEEMLDKFEARWPVGTTPRLVYSIALYFGHRRSDVAKVKPADFKVAHANVVQQKTGKALVLPIHPNLREVLNAIPDLETRDFVVLTVWGKPFSVKALGMRMQKWTELAGVPPGHTLHGLRKTLGKTLAEYEATTRQLMGMLGHDSIAHAELYSREAEQKRLARAAMEKLMNWRRPKAG